MFNWKLPPSVWLNAFLPPVLWAALIFYLSSQSSLQGFELDTLDFVFKKSAHMFVYGVLYWLFYRAAQLVLNKTAQKQHWQWSLPLIAIIIYAISDELHQTFVPGRTGTLRDIGYDTLGASIVFLWKYRYI
jgi:VanZ family protein